MVVKDPDQCRNRNKGQQWAALLIVLVFTKYVYEVEAKPIPSTASTHIDSAATNPADSNSETRRLLHWRQTFFWAIVLVLIFFLAALVIIRFTLRYRAYLFRERQKPTPSEDVWQMHRLPEDDVGPQDESLP
jgi:hypothetical protein